MAFTLSRNLKLRLDSNLTANALYNLNRIDLLGSTFLVDSTDSLNIRSRSNILIQPDSADLGGSSSGGTVTIGDASAPAETLAINADELLISSPLSLKDQATGGTKYLQLLYKSDLNGSLDTAADRILSVDLDAANRSLVLAGNLSILGGNISFTTPSSSTVTLPITGTLATLAGIETLTNKTIDADSNTLSNVRNANIAASAGITHSKLNLLNSITNSDISTSAAISYSKLNLASSLIDNDIAAGAAISRSKLASGTPSWVVINDGSGTMSSEEHLSKARGGAGANMSSVTFPSTGVLVTEGGTQILTGKTIDGNSNTITNISSSAVDLTDVITNADINSSAAIAYSKLNLTGSIVNADVNASAALARSKLAAGTASHVVINDGSGVFSSEANLAISRGGTGAGTAADARNNLLPTQTGNSGKFLKTDGSNASWETVAGSGTVTSVNMTVPPILSVSGNPITTSGTLAVTLVDQVANRIFAGPATGADAAPTFRVLAVADIPTGIPAVNIGTGSVDNTELGYLNGVTSSVQGQLDSKQPLDSTLTALAAFNTNGFLVQTGADTFVARSLAAGTGISITNLNGGSGDPSISTTITQYTDELAQDAVGGILTASASIGLTYSDATPSITADVIPGGVDHDQLLNFVANKHVDHSAVSIATASTSGLSGGGNITATRNLVVAPTEATAATPAAGDILLFADISNSNALRKATFQEVLDLGGGKYTATWTTGTSDTFTHGFGTTDITVNIYDVDSGEEIFVHSIVRDDSNDITLTASQAPTGSGWRVVVRK